VHAGDGQTTQRRDGGWTGDIVELIKRSVKREGRARPVFQATARYSQQRMPRASTDVKNFFVFFLPPRAAPPPPHPFLFLRRNRSTAVEKAGGTSDVGRRALGKNRPQVPRTTPKVYIACCRRCAKAVIIHWIGDMFRSGIGEYWGTPSLDKAMMSRSAS